jgi:hypothetical protein
MKNGVLWCCAVVSLFAGCSQSNWKVVEKKSEMGDGTEITATLESSREVKRKSGIVHPSVNIEVSRGKATLTANSRDVLNLHSVDGVRVTTLRVRFDEEAPLEILVVELPESFGSTVLFNTATGRILVDAMLKHEVMKIEWTTVHEKVVDSFNLKGLRSIVDDICKKVPAACTGDSPLVAGAPSNSAAATATPPSASRPQLSVGKYPVASSQWKHARELALSWCKSNANACDESVVQQLNRPRAGAELEVSGDEAHLSTCTYENCPGVLTDVTLKKVGAAWNVSSVETAAAG